MSELSNKLTSLRENEGWSKTKVASYLKVSPQRYSNWEYGTREPDTEMIKKIAKLYSISIDELLGVIPKNTKEVDIEKDPVVLSYGGRPVSDEDMEIIKAILEQRRND